MKYVNEDLRNDIRRELERAVRTVKGGEIDAAVDAMEGLFERWWRMRAAAALV